MSRHRFFAHVPGAMLPRYLPALESLPVGLEILMDHEALAPERRAEMERLGLGLRQRGIPCRFHAPFRDINPGGFDPDVLAITRERLTAALEMAEPFGVDQLVAHTGWDPRMYGLDRAAWLDRAGIFWRDLGETAARHGCRFGLENVFDLQPALLADLLRRLPEETFGVNFDFGHWFAWGEAPLADWFDLLGERMLSLHLHDNHGVNDDHLAVGAGAIPWSEVFAQVRRLGRPLDWTVENRSVEAVVESARRIGRDADVSDLAHLAESSVPGAVED